eukprot:6105137-Amphidinium_carterae.1
MRGLRLGLSRSSQGWLHNHSRGREPGPQPGFRPISQLWSKQKPKESLSLSHHRPTKVLLRRLVLSVSSSP